MRFCFKSTAGAVQCISLILSVLVSHMVCAQETGTGLVLYDNFDERFLDPTKWEGQFFGACSTVTALECVREIQDEKLRLAARIQGWPNVGRYGKENFLTALILVVTASIS